MFHIEPDRCSIEGGCSEEFSIICLGRKAGQVSEKILGKVEEGRMWKPMFPVDLTVMLTVPLLELSERTLSFEYIHSMESKMAPQVRTERSCACLVILVRFAEAALLVSRSVP